MTSSEFDFERSSNERLVFQEEVYKRQLELQQPEGMSKLLEKIADTVKKISDCEEHLVPEELEREVELIIESNVGVVEKCDVQKQNELNSEISRLTDVLFSKTHPKLYELTLQAIVADLPEEVAKNIYDGEAVKKYILGMESPVIRQIKKYCKLVK